MAYNEKLANRIREGLIEKKVEEKKMMGGLTFMVNGKMCVGVLKDEMMCRISPDLHESAIERTGCRSMDFTGRPMRGFVMIDEQGMKSQNYFEYWLNLSLDYNQRAKRSKQK